MQQSFIKQKQT